MLFNILITKDIAQCVSVLTYMHVCYGPVALNENKIIVLYCIYYIFHLGYFLKETSRYCRSPYIVVVVYVLQKL